MRVSGRAARPIPTRQILLRWTGWFLFGNVWLIVAALLGWGIGWTTCIAFLSGASCSVLAGYIGMKSATKTNAMRLCLSFYNEGTVESAWTGVTVQYRLNRR